MEKKIIALKPFNNKIFYKNAVFNEDSKIGSSYLIAARKRLLKKNIVMNTIDIATSSSTEKDVYMDIPYPWELKLWIRIIMNRKKNVLFIVEPSIINPFNYMKLFHLFFLRIYTCDDRLLDDRKYFKYYPPLKISDPKVKQIPFKKKKLLIMMNINWLPFIPFKLLAPSTKELYSERIKALNFFDRYYTNDFCLYGRGWNRPQRFSIRQRVFGCKKYKTYRGEFDSKDKYNTLSQFRFCLVFENCIAEGNISEKIFDCFKAGCVPVYLGAPNITNFISEKCFIDFRKFKSYKDLAQFLTMMDENTYNEYQRSIEKFLLSTEIENWSLDAFAKLFLELRNF